MSLEHISSAWKAELDKGKAEERFYIDPRGLRYPPLTGHNLQYNTARSDYNFTGTRSAFIGTANYPSSGLVAHYTMDNVSGTTLTDDFGANDGTITGAVQVAGVPGLGKALRFDGVDDFVNVAHDTDFDFGTGDFSVSCWISGSVGDAFTYFTIVGKRLFSSSSGWMLTRRRTDGRVVLFTGNGASFDLTQSDSDVGDNAVHVVAGRSSGVTYLYINGVKQSDTEASTANVNIAQPMHIGSDQGNAQFFWTGAIDDVRIYNRALTETEIEYLYNVRTNVLSDIEPDYLVDMAETFTLRLVVRPWFDYTSVTFNRLVEWYISSTQRLTVSYNSTNDYINAFYIDGGAARLLTSQQFDDGTTYTDLNQWLTIDVAIDLSTGTTAGSQLWVNKVSQDTTWSGAIDAKVSNFPRLSFGHENGGANAQTEFAYAMYIPNYIATDADIQNDYADVKNEAIVWDFNGEGVGRTRCDVTDYVFSYSASYKVEEPMTGSAGANSLSFSLESTDGAFNDDVYATFDPTSTNAGRYNGLITQKYLQRRIRAEAETWYNGDWEPFFVGKVDESLFSRTSQTGDITRVQVSAEDAVVDIATAARDKGQTWEDYQLADTDEDTSLVHAVARIGTQKTIRNYLSDSGFENATITTAWTSSGGSFSLARDTANEFIGTACAELDATLATGNVSQTVTFTGDKVLNVGETYTFSVYVKSATAATVTVDLEEHDSVGQNDETTNAVSIAATQDYYERATVTHTITDGDSDRLVCRINVSGGDVVYADACMLTQSGRAYNWYVDNTATSKSADDYAETGYDDVGFVVEPILTYTDESGVIHTDTYTHPWALIKEGESPWSLLKRIADAGASIYIGVDPSGCFKFRCVLGGWAEPADSGTISDTLVVGVATSLDAVTANRVVVNGVFIKKDAFEKYLWGGTASDLFSSDGEGTKSSNVANGDQFPDPDVYGRFFADLRNVEGQELTREATSRSQATDVDLSLVSAFNSALRRPGMT